MGNCAVVGPIVATRYGVKEFGHKDLRTTQQCYCYDLTTDEERYEKIAQSLA